MKSHANEGLLMGDRANETQSDDTEDERQRRRDHEDTVELIATSTVRLGLLVLGIILLLYSIGQAAGFDVLGLISQALDTPEARWLIVAFFALILITIALRGFR